MLGTTADREARLSEARAHLRQADPVIGQLLDAHPDFDPRTWLAELPRMDVVLPGDLALRKAIQRAYRLDHLPSQQEVLQIAEPGRPFRTLASAYLIATAFE